MRACTDNDLQGLISILDANPTCDTCWLLLLSSPRINIPSQKIRQGPQAVLQYLRPPSTTNSSVSPTSTPPSSRIGSVSGSVFGQSNCVVELNPLVPSTSTETWTSPSSGRPSGSVSGSTFDQSPSQSSVPPQRQSPMRTNGDFASTENRSNPFHIA